jgi:hypothetical protein
VDLTSTSWLNWVIISGKLTIQTKSGYSFTCFTNPSRCVHEHFFSFIKSAIPKISKKKIPIVIDREPGIQKAIQTILPDCPYQI